jgi:RNA polymerase sigma-70 factor (family 1)
MIGMDDDKFLIQKVMVNDQHALEQLFQRYYFKLLRYAQLLLPHPSDVAEEVVMDVFVKLWNQPQDFDFHTSLASFLYKAVKNRALDYSRKSNIRIQVPVDMAEQEAGQAFMIPDQQLSFKELAKGMEQLIGMLPERTQLVFRMNRHDELSYQEVATLLDISINSVKTHMYRAVKFLKESYQAAKTSGHY